MDMDVPAGFFMAALERSDRERRVADGLAAAIEMYYYEYTDATELEPHMVSAIERLVSLTEANIDVYYLIRDTERSINDRFEPLYDSEGNPRTVRTNHIWIAIEEEENG